MNNPTVARGVSRALLAICASLSLPSSAAAHRLDEYLQATRIAIDRNRIEVEIDLVPGIAVAREIFDDIDADHDGRVSSDETDQYARLVLSSIALEMDGRTEPLVLTGCHVSSWDDVRQGVGAIRLIAELRAAASGVGRHSLVYRNMHRPEIGVYLANLLVPKTADLRITSQKRDVLQRELHIDYEIAATWWTPASLWGLFAFASLLTPLIWRAAPGRQTGAAAMIGGAISSDRPL